MSQANDRNSSIRRTNDGAIDFRYYECRARCFRSHTAWELARRLFKGKQTPAADAAETCR